MTAGKECGSRWGFRYRGSKPAKATRTRRGMKQLYNSSSMDRTNESATTFKTRSSWLVDNPKNMLPVIPRTMAINNFGPKTNRQNEKRRAALSFSKRVVTSASSPEALSSLPTALIIVLSPTGVEWSPCMKTHTLVISPTIKVNQAICARRHRKTPPEVNLCKLS